MKLSQGTDSKETIKQTNKQMTYPSCAWSHSPWGRNNTRGTWLVRADAAPSTSMQSPHVAWNTQERQRTGHCAQKHRNTCKQVGFSKCMCSRVRESQKVKDGYSGRNDSGQLPILPATDTNKSCDFKAEPPSSSYTCSLPLSLPSSLLPVFVEGNLSPHLKERGSI